MLRLRYHHLNCIPCFEGKGYSPEFCKNMAAVKKRLESGEKFELVMSADDICFCCPNLQNGVCVNEAKVGKYDLKTKMLGTGNLENICSDCMWFDICKNK